MLKFSIQRLVPIPKHANPYSVVNPYIYKRDRDHKVKSSEVFDLGHRFKSQEVPKTPIGNYNARALPAMEERPKQLLDGKTPGALYRRDYLQRGPTTPYQNQIQHGCMALMCTTGCKWEAEYFTASEGISKNYMNLFKISFS